MPSNRSGSGRGQCSDSHPLREVSVGPLNRHFGPGLQGLAVSPCDDCDLQLTERLLSVINLLLINKTLFKQNKIKGSEHRVSVISSLHSNGAWKD